MSVNTYLDTINDEQTIVVYNNKHNIVYIGKAGYAPLNLYFEFKNAIVRDNELIINGVVEEVKTEEVKEETTEEVKTEEVEVTEETSEDATEEEITEILERAHHLRRTPYGKYFYRDDLRKIISDVMKYAYNTFYGVRNYLFDYKKVEAVEKTLVDKNLVKFSKNGNMFRFI